MYICSRYKSSNHSFIYLYHYEEIKSFFATPFFLLALVASSCSNMDEPLALQDSTRSLNSTRSKELRSARAYEVDATKEFKDIALEYVDNAKILLADDETYIKENI